MATLCKVRKGWGTRTRQEKTSVTSRLSPHFQRREDFV
jgi:hypothetical protein